jgi:hypothetical protein
MHDSKTMTHRKAIKVLAVGVLAHNVVALIKSTTRCRLTIAIARRSRTLCDHVNDYVVVNKSVMETLNTNQGGSHHAVEATHRS